MESQSFAPYNSQHASAPPTTEQSRLEQTRLDEKKRLKRAANRRSACTSRVRKKQFVEEMTAANERLAVYGAILARAPPTITVDEACAVRFASRSARELLGLDLGEALDGLNLVDLLAADDHQPAAARWVRAAAAGAKAEAPRWDPGAPPAADWRPLEWSASQGSVNVVSSDNSGGSDEARSGSDDGRNSSEDSDERPAVEDAADKRDKSPPPALPDLIGAAGAGGGFPRKRCYADVVDRQPVAAPPPPSFRADDGYREPSPHGSAASSGDDEAAPAGDGHRLCLVCRSGRVVVVDAVRGGSFASAQPVANVVGGGFGWTWAAAFLPAWRRRAFAAAMWLAIGMPAAPCRPRLAQPHSLVGMLMKATLAPTSSRFATDLAVLYGLLCSCARVPLGQCR